MPDKQIFVLDSQRLNTVQMCGYKYDLTFNRDLVPVEKRDFFERGDLLHKMLETYYKMHKYRARWPHDLNREEMMKILLRVGENHAVKLNLPMDEVDDVFRTVTDYVDYYWSSPEETLAVEQVGSKILYEDENLIIIYETKIDWIARFKNVDALPVDHKSSKRRGETIAISNQFMGYCWMLGVNNLMVNKVGFQRTLKNEEKFSRPILSYPKGVLDGWRRNTIYWVFELLKYEHLEYFPQNFTSCDKYPGCIFRPLCEAPPETRDHTAAQLFEVGKKWDVGAKL